MQGNDQGAAARPRPRPARIDGRRQRSLRTRQAIIEAYLGLLRENPQRPTGAQIAERAGCSIRSIFERFTDLDQLALAAIDHVTSGNNQIGLIDPLGQTEDRLIKPMTIGFINLVRFEAEMQICNLRN